MDGHKPKMCDARFQNRVDAAPADVKPIQKRAHFIFEAVIGGSFIMNALTPYGAGYDLHRSRLFVAPDANSNLGHTTAPRREKRSVPIKEAFGCQGLGIFFSCVENHFD